MIASPSQAPLPTAPLSNAVALRIGLAAQKLPTIDIGDLIVALHEVVGEVLDEAALSRVTVTHLKAAFRQSHDLDGDEDNEAFATATMADFKEAVRILWGETTPDELPALETFDATRGEASVRVAIASNQGEELDGHFGSCQRFLIYQLSAHQLRLVDIRATTLADQFPDKNGYRVSLLPDCRIVCVVSIGGPASAKVIKADIHIMQVKEGGKAREILGRLQKVIEHSPPPWLAKALGVAEGQRVKNYSANA